ncbi:MAG: DUF1883 domain-containing protein [Flavobacteriales bacterium]|jgi:hypothetical protein|nr:DUF1883 domain-containing protein [Flavobacteriales bacterium]
MKFLYRTFEAKKKEIIEVEIDQPTKVKFMSGKDVKAYRQGRTYSYYGGRFEESPVRFVVPYDAVWNVVVEKGTRAEPIAVRASCRLIPPNRTVLSTVAIDAPPGLGTPFDPDVEHIADLSIAARSEG